MGFRRSVGAVVASLLLAGTAFAFPYDPKPSEIDDEIFVGDWTNNLRGLDVDALRVMNFLDHEFKTTGAGPGGALDLMIWNSPSFSEDKVEADRKAWAELMENPGVDTRRNAGALNVGNLPGGGSGENNMYATHDEMIDFIEGLSKRNLTVEYLGEIPRGFPFPFMIFSKDNEDRSPEGLKATGRPLVWVQGNIHGGEWSTGEGVLAMAYDLANGRYDDLLDRVNVVMIPRVCADGAKVPSRTTGDLLALGWGHSPERRDINRDNLLLELPVSRVMRKMFLAYMPHYCVDLHERGGVFISNAVADRFGMLVDIDAHDIGASGSTILQVPQRLRAIRYDYMEEDLARIGARYGLYFGIYCEPTDTYVDGRRSNYAHGMVYEDAGYESGFVSNSEWDLDAPYLLVSEASYNTRSSRNVNALYGVVSQLFENKSGPTNVGNRGMFERRVAAGYVCILSTITTAAKRSDEILPVIEDMRREFVKQGKSITSDDVIPILAVQSKPVYVDRQWTVIDISKDYTQVMGEELRADDLGEICRYDGTLALEFVGEGLGYGSSDYRPVKGTGSRERQFFKVESTWDGTCVRERVRPYAYIFEGPYGVELARRMMLAGIEVKRLAKDVTVQVEGWRYNEVPYVDLSNGGSSGWLNRNVSVYPVTRTFRKDSFVVYLGQLTSNLIPMYMEPDIPWNAASCVLLPRMSVDAGGSASGFLSSRLMGVEMPVYRYLKEQDLPTYDVNHFLPLIDRGAVVRFLSYHTEEELAAVAEEVGFGNVKVFDYDVQVHSRTNSLKADGTFDITLPTSEGNRGYYIMTVYDTYEPLVPHLRSMGWDVATVDVARHGVLPFSVELDEEGRPLVGKVVERDLPENDDLVGLRIVEIFEGEEPVLDYNVELSALGLLGATGLVFRRRRFRSERDRKTKKHMVN